MPTHSHGNLTHATVIIAGGGPAGATCARELRKHGIDTLVLEKRQFPRTKLCAGWITPKVLSDLELRPRDYPHGILSYRCIRFYFRGVPVPVPTFQYAIRRREFDDFLLKRANVPVHRHEIRNIRQTDDGYVIDNIYHCTYLVGAGGSFCPVYRQIFSNTHAREPGRTIVTVEEEFPYKWHNPDCRLWFFDHGLPGYSWYVPKRNGYLNVGIGGKLSSLKKRGETINDHWGRLVQKLSRAGLVTGRRFAPKGHVYHLSGATATVRQGNACLIGDAAGLATLDMGEGIGPAIESARLAAHAIATGTPYTTRAVTRWSAPQILSGRLSREKGVALSG